MGAAQDKHLISVLPLIAKTMGEQVGVKVRFGPYSTACTDGKDIFLPFLPAEGEEIAVLVNGYIDHEASHIRYTDFTVKKKKGPHGALLNILEDLRIEQNIVKRFPGSRKHLAQLVRLLTETEKGFTPPDEDANAVNHLIHTVLVCGRSDVLGQSALDDRANEAEKLFIRKMGKVAMTRLQGLIDQARRLESTQQASDLADEILVMLEDEQKKQEEKSQKQQSSDSDDNAGETEDGDDSDDTSSGSDPDASEDEDGDGDPDSDQENGDGGDAEDDAPKDSDGDDEDAGDGDESDQDEAEGDESGKGNGDEDDEADDAESESGQGDDDSGESEPADAEGTGENQDDQADPDTGDGSDEDSAEIAKALAEALGAGDEDIETASDLGDAVSEQLRNDIDEEARKGNEPIPTEIPEGDFPTGEWESRADSAVDPSEVRHETTKLRTKLRAKLETLQRGQRHTSYAGRRINQRKLAGVKTGDTRIFEKKIEGQELDTAVQVLVDRSGSMGMAQAMGPAMKAAMSVMQALEGMDGVASSCAVFPSNTMLTRFDEPLKRTLRRYEPVSTGGTPLTEALLWVSRNSLARRAESRKILLVCTDGEPDDPGSAKAVINRLSRSDIEVIGIGIGTMVVDGLFPEHAVIQSVNELPEKLFKLIDAKLG